MTKLRIRSQKKKTLRNQIFKLEERVLFDGAAADIVASVDAASQQNQNQDHADSEQDKEQQFINLTVQAAGPVDTPAPESNVQNQGEGLPQADAAQQDPADILINGTAALPDLTDPGAGFSADAGDAADSSLSVSDPRIPSELIVIDSQAADHIDPAYLEGKNVLVLDGVSDAGDQINHFLDEHDDQTFDSVKFVSDFDSNDADTLSETDFNAHLLDSEDVSAISGRLSGSESVEIVSTSDFQSELSAESSDLIVIPDHDSILSVEDHSLDPETSSVPDSLVSDAEADRHELVIVNSSTADLDNVLDQLGDSREVLVIDSSMDAFEQISDFLDNSDTSYDAVHILTHGNDEGFYLGHQKVVAADQMAVFDGHLAENADFMLYGCDLASTERGQTLIHDIADLTGADVAASVNTTGAAVFGGDWNLEYNSGAIETASITLNPSWNHQLATITVDSSAAESAGKSYKTFANALNYIAASGSDGDIIEIKKVGDADHGPTLPYTLSKNLSIQLAADATENYIWNISNTLTLNADLTIAEGITLNYNGSTIQVNAGKTLMFLSAANAQTHTAQVDLVGAESQLSVGANTTVNAVTGAANAGIAMTGSSTIGTLNLTGGTWTLSTGTVNTLYNDAAAITTGSGASFGTVSNSGAFTLNSGSVGTLNHNAGAVPLVVNGGNVTTLNANDSATISGGTITTANLTGGTIGISGGNIDTVNASTDLNLSGGTIEKLYQTAATLNFTGGAVTVLTNSATASITNAAATVDHLLNSGTVTYTAGNVKDVENQTGGNINFKGGNVSGTVNNAQGAFLHFNNDTSTGQIENSGTVNLNGGITLSIETDSNSRAIINRKTGTINFTSATLANPNSTGPGVYMGIGLSNTDGGTVNAGAGDATISGFAFATEQAYTSPPSYFAFTSNNNGVDILSSITVTGEDTGNTVETVDKALAMIVANPGTYFSINILLDLTDYLKWDTFLTVSGTYASPISNLRGITSNTKVNSQYITQNVILNTDLTLTPADSDHTVLFNDVSMTINAGKSLTVTGTLALNGASPQISSVSDLSSPYPSATLKSGASTLVNNGTLTVTGNVTGTYNNITGKLQSIVNNGTFTLTGNYILKALSVSSSDIVSGILPEVDLIYNAGTFTANTGSAITGTIPLYTTTAAMLRNTNTGKAEITGSALTLQSDSGNNAFAIYNDGKLTLTDTFVDAAGSRTYGIFNGVNGDASFKVTQLTDIDLAEFAAKAAGNQVLREYAEQVYHIKGSAYSVYNQGKFATVTNVPGGAGYSIVNGLLTGTKGSISYKDAPVSALIGDFRTDAPADGSASTGLSDITLVGSFASFGSAKNNLTNLRLNGALDNTISEIYVAGAFMSSDLTVGNNTNSYNGYYGNSGNHTALTITNNMSATEGSRKGGAIYFGQKAASKVTFKSDLDYIFYNLSGEMLFDYFGGLSSENNPVQFFNRGVMTIDGTNADGKIDGLYRLYVEQVSGYVVPHSGVNYIVADSISDAGIVNFYANDYNEASPIENQLTLTGLDIRNTHDGSAAVTNYAGNLTINGGKLSATYSALDNMEQHIIYFRNNSHYTFDVITGIARLNDVQEIAGSAYSIRNNGELTVTGPGSGNYTLLTNQLAFSSNYQGGYTAVLNSFIDVSVWEKDVTANNVTRGTVYYGWNSAFSSMDSSPLTTRQGTHFLASSHLYHMTSASISDRTEITLTYAGPYTPSGGSYTDHYYNPVKVVSSGEASLDQISLRAQSTPGTNTAFSNWGDLNVKGIDGTNAVNGFKFMLDVSSSYYSTYSHSGTVTVTPETVTSSSDIEAGFEITASTIKSDTPQWKVTMRGVKDPGSTYGYLGNFAVNGSALSVSGYGELSLINFSVFAKNAANAIQVDGGGMLHVYNGVYDDATHQWIGGSSAVISSDGNANGVMLYGSMELINGAITECVNGIVASATAGPVLVINSTIAGNSGWGIISNFAAPAETSKHNLFVADSTVAYNGQGGIQVNNGGKLSMLNSIVLNRNTTGTDSVDIVLNDGSTMAEGFEGNVYGSSASDTNTKMNTVYGSLSLVWSGPDMYTISQVEDNTYAWNTSIQWSFNDDGSNRLFLTEIVLGSGGSYSITYDKLGNSRQPSGDRIGSYVLSGSVGPTVILVNTLQDNDDIIPGPNKLYSLRYVIKYLLSADNTSSSTTVAFDWGALHDEAGADNMTISLSNTYGTTLDVSYTPGTSLIDSLTIDLAASGHAIPSGYTLNINGSGLSGSTFTVSGIALSVNGAQALTVTGATTANNGAAFNLANVANTSLNLSDATVTGGNTTGNGGAVYVGAAAGLAVTGTAFSNNIAADGGAIYNDGGKVSGSATFSGNKANGNGGAVFNTASGNFTLEGNLSDNTATAGNGGAVYMDSGTVTLTGNITGTAGNTAAVNGGAAYVSGGTLAVTGNLSNNEVSADGGAIYLAGGTATVTGNITGTAGNTAAVNGGAAYVSGGTLSISGNLSNNEVSADGGAIYSTGGTTTVTGNLVNNIAAGDGGAVAVANGSVSITGNLQGNSATTGDGGAVAVMNGSVTITGDLQGNTAASGNGGAVYAAGGTATVKGNITDYNGTANSALNGSAVYVSGGFVQIGSLDTYATISGNDASLFDVSAGDLLVVNAAVSGNGTGSANDLFTVSGGRLTLLNTTVNKNGNTGNVLNQTGGTVQIGDSTIYQPNSTVSFTSGILDVFNSIINISGNLVPTNPEETRHSIINGDDTKIFSWKNGEPESSTHGTLKIKLSGPAMSGGSMVGYTYDAVNGTTLYYTTDGTNWYDADGNPAAPAVQAAITAVTASQNGADRDYAGYKNLNIGAYSISGGTQSLVVTLSGDESQETGTTLRDALQYAAFLYDQGGAVQTVTFQVNEVALNSAITIDCPVNITGSGVTVKADPASFADDSVFTLTGGDILLAGLTIEGMTGVRGIDVNGSNLTLSEVTIQNGDAASAGNDGGAVLVQNGTLSGSDVKLLNNKAVSGAAISSIGEVAMSNVTVSGNQASNGDVISAGGAVTLSGHSTLSGNQAANGSVIDAAGNVTIDGSVSGNTAAVHVIGAGGDASVKGSVSGNTATSGAVVFASGSVLSNASVTGNIAGFDVIYADTGDVNVSGTVSGNTAGSDLISAFKGNTNVSGSVTGNTAGLDVIYAGGDMQLISASVIGNNAQNIVDAVGTVAVADSSVSGNTAENGIIRGDTLSLDNAVINGNIATTKSVLKATAGDVTVLNTTLSDNKAYLDVIGTGGGDVVMVNTTMAENTGDAVDAKNGTAKIVNSIVLGEVNAGDVQAAYSVFGKTPKNLSVNENNEMNASEGSLFAGRDDAGHLVVREDSVAAVGVWTAYNPDTGDLYFSTRPEWTDSYSAPNMQWNKLGGGQVPYATVSSYLLTDPGEYPSIGGYSSGEFHPDFGPGVNSNLVNPGYNGGFGLDWGYNSLVNGYYQGFGMGLYSQLYEQLFGPDYSRQSFSVLNGRSDLGGVPGWENSLNLSVGGVLEEEFDEFIESPYYEDGTPLNQTELNAIRNAAVTGRRPEESLHLEEAVREQVAASLRKAELFKDSFDKALDLLLGQDA